MEKTASKTMITGILNNIPESELLDYVLSVMYDPIREAVLEQEAENQTP